MANRHDRQSDIVRAADLERPVHILGAGGIGSWTALIAAKMGCTNIFVYDDDVVEDHNVASQFFKEEQIGEKKVNALKENILEQTGIEINAITDIEEEEFIAKSLVVIAIDSMSERIRLGEIYEGSGNFIIDGRMGGLSFEIHNSCADNYLSTTVKPDEVDTDACTMKSISFNCLVIGGIIANNIKRFSKKESLYKLMMMDLNSLTVVKKDRMRYLESYNQYFHEDTAEEIIRDDENTDMESGF